MGKILEFLTIIIAQFDVYFIHRFIAAVLVYFIAGMAVNYNRGTRGCEWSL